MSNTDLNSAFKLRPSSLPKIAQCLKFDGSGPAGAAADRGTRMDKAFRFLLSGIEPDLCADDTFSLQEWALMADEDEHSAVYWSIATAELFARGSDLEAREEKLLVDPGCGINPGTADLLCAEQGWSADLKSGQLRGYMEQQRAYALGFMDAYFVDEWTVYLLFCDERKVETLKFTKEEALDEQRSLVAAFKDPLAVATPCDYCDWCARRWKCPQKLESVAWFLGIEPSNIDLTTYCRDAEKVGALLEMTHAVAKDDGVHDMLKAGALSLVAGGTPVDGWRLQSGRSTETALAIQLAPVVEKIGAQRVLAKLGNVTGNKFTELWCEANGTDPIPEGIIKTNHGAAFLVKKKASKAKNKTATATETTEE